MKEDLKAIGALDAAKDMLAWTRNVFEKRNNWSQFVCVMLDDAKTHIPFAERGPYWDAYSVLKNYIQRRISPYNTVECFLANSPDFPCNFLDEDVDRIDIDSRTYRLNMLDEMIKELA